MENEQIWKRWHVCDKFECGTKSNNEEKLPAYTKA